MALPKDHTVPASMLQRSFSRANVVTKSPVKEMMGKIKVPKFDQNHYMTRAASYHQRVKSDIKGAILSRPFSRVESALSLL